MSSDSVRVWLRKIKYWRCWPAPECSRAAVGYCWAGNLPKKHLTHRFIVRVSGTFSSTGPIIRIMSPVCSRQKDHVTPFYFCKFFGRLSLRPTAKAPRGGGLFAFLLRPLSGGQLARCRFLLGASAKKHSSRTRRGKGEVFTLGLSDARLLSGRLRFRPTYPAGRSELCAKARDLDGIACRASGQVRSYFGTWAASRAKTIFAILIASCSLKRWVQVAAFTC